MSAITRRLVRLSRSTPLPTLKQGGTLSFRSKIPNVSVRIQPEWRDDGHATFLQNLGYTNSSGNISKKTETSMIVSQENDKVTSLGRKESHISISLEPREEATTIESLLFQSMQAPPDRGQENSIAFEDGNSEVTAWLSGEDEVEGQDHQPVEEDSVTLVVPEKVNIVCELDRAGSIQVDSKIEGDIRLMTTEGDIWVKKLRGHTIDLETRSPTSKIYATDLLEAYDLKLNLLQGGRLRAKRIHGDTINIRMEAPQDNMNSFSANSKPLDEDDDGSLVDISSMYVSGTGGAQISLNEGLRPEKRAVRIKSHHGPVLVDVSGVFKPTMTNSTPTKNSDSDIGYYYPLVEFGSINGSCELSVRDIQSDQTGQDYDSWISCQVHYGSVSPESVSLIQTDTGNIALTFDRKLEADLRFLSITDVDSLEETAGVLADEDDPDKVMASLNHLKEAPDAAPQSEASRIIIQTHSYTENGRYVSPNKTVEYVEGWVENRSHEPDSRFEMKTRGDGGGKIRHTDASDQALKQFSSPEKPGHADPSRPLIVAATTGTISVETLSWLGAIARRYGLDEQGRDLGRQATSRGRSVLPSDE